MVRESKPEFSQSRTISQSSVLFVTVNAWDSYGNKPDCYCYCFDTVHVMAAVVHRKPVTHNLKTTFYNFIHLHTIMQKYVTLIYMNYADAVTELVES